MPSDIRFSMDKKNLSIAQTETIAVLLERSKNLVSPTIQSKMGHTILMMYYDMFA